MSADVRKDTERVLIQPEKFFIRTEGYFPAAGTFAPYVPLPAGSSESVPKVLIKNFEGYL